MKSNKTFLNMDERNMLVALKIIARMYFLTIIAMQVVVMYRQFVLGQSIYDFEDFAVILTFNSLFLLCALLYFGAIPVQQIKIKVILLGYAAIVVLGSVFTYVKYNIFQGAELSVSQMVDKIFIVISVSGIIVFFFVMFSILGKRKLDREIEN